MGVKQYQSASTKQEIIDTINSAPEIPWPLNAADLMRPERQPAKSVITFL